MTQMASENINWLSSEELAALSPEAARALDAFNNSVKSMWAEFQLEASKHISGIPAGHEVRWQRGKWGSIGLEVRPIKTAKAKGLSPEVAKLFTKSASGMTPKASTFARAK